MRWIFLAIALLIAGWLSLSFWLTPTVTAARDVSELLTIHSDDICRAPLPDAATRQFSEVGGGADDELPIDIAITSSFRLFDQDGARRSRDNLFQGKLSLVFFGYASCEGVCLLAIPAIADASEIIAERAGLKASLIQPVLITIDPARDTAEFLKTQLADFSDRFIGLTGPEPALKNARRMFNIQSSPVFEDAKGTVFQHGSFIFVVDEDANVVSMLPPVLPPEQIAEIALKYL